jgi:hypothetical protein
MKQILLSLLILFGQHTSSFAISNTGAWEIHQAENWISKPIKSWTRARTGCLLFDSYWIVTKEYVDRVGSDIVVFKRNPNETFPDSCNMDHEKALVHYHDGDYGSVAVNSDTLFLDSGTGNWRGLEIISLKNKKIIATTGYNGSVGKLSIAAGMLIYEGPLENQDSDRSAWQIVRKCVWGPEHKPKGWFMESYSGTRQIDLITGKQTVTNVTCSVEHAAG